MSVSAALFTLTEVWVSKNAMGRISFTADIWSNQDRVSYLCHGANLVYCRYLVQSGSGVLPCHDGTLDCQSGRNQYIAFEVHSNRLSSLAQKAHGQVTCQNSHTSLRQSGCNSQSRSNIISPVLRPLTSVSNAITGWPLHLG